MYDDLVLNEKYSNDMTRVEDSSRNLDTLFNNLSDDIISFNKYVDGINKQKKENSIEEKELIEERQKLDKIKFDFESYVKAKNLEFEKMVKDIEDYSNSEKQKLAKLQSDFKANMDNALNELDINKKELEIQKDKFREEKEQFEDYKKIEVSRIKHSEEILDSEKEQFDKYKEVTIKKIELENKNLEQKCEKLRNLISQFNLSFKPVVKEEKEG